MATISGAPQSISTAVQLVMTIIEEDPQVVASADQTASDQKELKCVLSNNEAGRIIGKGGATIKAMRETTGAQIRMDPETAGDRVVTLSGTRVSIVMAHSEIIDIIKDMPPDSGKRPMVAPAGYPAQYPQEHNPYSQPPPQYGQPPAPSPYAPYGAPPAPPGFAAYGQPPPYMPAAAAYNAAYSSSGAAPAGDPPPAGTLDQLVTQDVAGRLIGRGGAGIKELRLKCKARITIGAECEPGTEFRKVTVTGPIEDIYEAIGHIMQVMFAQRM